MTSSRFALAIAGAALCAAAPIACIDFDQDLTECSTNHRCDLTQRPDGGAVEADSGAPADDAGADAGADGGVIDGGQRDGGGPAEDVETMCVSWAGDGGLQVCQENPYPIGER